MTDAWSRPLLYERFARTLESHGASLIQLDQAREVYYALGPILIWDALEGILRALTEPSSGERTFNPVALALLSYAATTPETERSETRVRAIAWNGLKALPPLPAPDASPPP